MENSILNIVKDIYSYDHFVNKMELEYSFSNLWLEMEILNAIALNDWELSGKPHEWSTWKDKYQKNAEKLVLAFLSENPKILCY